MWFEKARLEELVQTRESIHPDAWYQNCAGFALGVQGWWSPGEDERWFCDTAWDYGKNNNGWRHFENRHFLNVTFLT